MAKSRIFALRVLNGDYGILVVHTDCMGTATVHADVVPLKDLEILLIDTRQQANFASICWKRINRGLDVDKVAEAGGPITNCISAAGTNARKRRKFFAAVMYNSAGVWTSRHGIPLN